MINEGGYNIYLGFIETLMNLNIEQRLSRHRDDEVVYVHSGEYAVLFEKWRDKWLV
jgi:hypothetical protein